MIPLGGLLRNKPPHRANKLLHRVCVVCVTQKGYWKKKKGGRGRERAASNDSSPKRAKHQIIKGLSGMGDLRSGEMRTDYARGEFLLHGERVLNFCRSQEKK